MFSLIVPPAALLFLSLLTVLAALAFLHVPYLATRLVEVRRRTGAVLYTAMVLEVLFWLFPATGVGLDSDLPRTIPVWVLAEQIQQVGLLNFYGVLVGQDIFGEYVYRLMAAVTAIVGSYLIAGLMTGDDNSYTVVGSVRRGTVLGGSLLVVLQMLSPAPYHSTSSYPPDFPTCGRLDRHAHACTYSTRSAWVTPEAAADLLEIPLQDFLTDNPTLVRNVAAQKGTLLTVWRLRPNFQPAASAEAGRW